MIADVLAQISEGSPLAPALGLLAGVLLGLSPVALPAVPVVMSALSPGQLDEAGRRSTAVRQAAPAVVAFVIGMDGVLALAGGVSTRLPGEHGSGLLPDSRRPGQQQEPGPSLSSSAWTTGWTSR